VLAAVVACAVITTALGVHYAGTYSAGRLDRALDLRIKARLADHHHLLDHLVHLGDPQTVIAFVLLLAIVAGIRDRWRAVALVIVGTTVAVALTELILKPLVGRHIGQALSFPSGHTTGAFAIAIAAVVLLFADRGVRPPLRAVLIVLSLGLAAGVAAAVVGLGFHYTTDTVGGFCVALGSVLGVAVLIDYVADRRSQLPAMLRNRW
jgi:membrane-associated phospholipid phosphatase